jgi:mono/diheme cytochrome c family protein
MTNTMVVPSNHTQKLVDIFLNRGEALKSKTADRSRKQSSGMVCLFVVALISTSVASQVIASDDTSRGEYLTTILGCGGCHTEGALLGKPTGEWLTGSRIGVAYTNDLPDQTPGIVFPANLTADKATGLGKWSKRDIIRFLRTGLDHYGEQSSTVMPWPNYALLNDADVADIADYLLNLAPVDNKIPDAIAAGDAVNQSFVRIGVYLFIPEEKQQEVQHD